MRNYLCAFVLIFGVTI